MVNGKKMYYSISEVCMMTDLEPHVLRYWESEFSQLHPKKNRAGNRAYRQKDIDIIKYIKFLLYDEKFTIPGARKKITEMKDGEWEQLTLNLPKPAEKNSISIEEIRLELSDILEMLKITEKVETP
jgi:DNA-binding transcriptional MerR regulator